LDNPYLDESKEIIEYAKYIQSNSHLSILSDAVALSMFEEVLDSIKEPLADEGIYPSLLVSKLARKYVKVALSGEGADELFWGYYPRHASIIRKDSDKYENTGVRYFSFFSGFTKEQFNNCFKDIDWCPVEQGFFNFNSNDPEENALFMRQYEFEMYLPFILLKTDRSSMYHSLEVRVPFLDREVIDLATQINFKMCIDINREIGKLPLRKLLRKFVPSQTKSKKGFTIPIHEWIRKPLRGIVEESLKDLSGFDCLDINKDAINSMFKNHISGIENNGRALWQLLILDKWVKKHL